MINKKIGYLTIIAENKQLYQNSMRTFYTCKCVCGKIVTRRSDYVKKLIKNSSKTASCGCKHPNKQKGNKSKTWKGCGQVSGHYIASLRVRARRKNIDFNITPEYAWNLFIKQDQKCAISQEKITLSESYRTNQIMTASIDRIDPNKGYIIGNIQWVHIIINYMKHQLTNKDFISWCKKVADHNS